MPGWLSRRDRRGRSSAPPDRGARMGRKCPSATSAVPRSCRRVRIEFDGVRVSSAGWAVAARAAALFAREPVALDVNTAWSLSDERRVAGIAHAVGDLDRLLVDASVDRPGYRARHGRGQESFRRPALARQGRDRDARPHAMDRRIRPSGPCARTLAIEGDRSHTRRRASSRARACPKPALAWKRAGELRRPGR